MLNNSKRISLILILMILSSLLVSPQTGFASNLTNENGNSLILTGVVSEKIISYAKENFKKQMQDVLINEDCYKIFVDDESNIQLGTPKALYNYNIENDVFSETNIYYFPITEDRKIIATYAIAELPNGTLTGTLSKSFAEEFNRIIQSSSEFSTFSLIKVDSTIYLIDCKGLYQMETDNNNSSGLKSSEYKQQLLDHYKSIIVSNDINQSRSISMPTNAIQRYSDPGAPVDYARMDVPIVLQNGMNWCWAATCASIINYRKGLSLNASTVVVYVFGSALNQGGTWNDIKAAYNHWGMYPSQYNYLTYYQAKNVLKSNTPIHASFLTSPNNWDLYGHSMTIRGFEEYSSTEKYYLLIDPNKNYGVSVTAYDNGNNVTYILNGDIYYWNYARY